MVSTIRRLKLCAGGPLAPVLLVRLPVVDGEFRASHSAVHIRIAHCWSLAAQEKAQLKLLAGCGVLTAPNVDSQKPFGAEQLLHSRMDFTLEQPAEVEAYLDLVVAGVQLQWNCI